MTGTAGPPVLAPDPLVATGSWRRLDARMLLVHPVNEVVRFLPALIGVFFIGRSLDEGGWWHLAAVAVPIVLGILRFATTTFRVADGQLQLRRGLVNRTQVTARLDRIRTIELTASPIHRLLKLAKVEIGTASVAGGSADRLKLDSLSLPQARAMRAALLHRAGSHGEPAPTGGTAAATVTGRADPTGADARGGDEILLRLNPRWVRYAPLTTAGLVVAGAVAGASGQFAGPLAGRLVDAAGAGARSVPLGLIVAIAVVAVVVVISVLSVIGYVVNYWGFALSRDRAGHSYHVTRGLLTSRETSVEIARTRGVEVHEPLGLRLLGAARLDAMVTGMSRREAGQALVVPPAPQAVVRRVAAVLLGGAEVLATPLVVHGPLAVRRRYLRALTVSLLVAVAWTVAVLQWRWTGWLLVLDALAPPVAVLLARDRARRLGHALTPRFLISRAHCLRGRRTVLAREGIIGWNLRQSFFQRRAGLVTLTATTAAGKQGYPVYDVPVADGLALADEAVPGLLTPFLVAAGGQG